jgi:hypothetical protein
LLAWFFDDEKKYNHLLLSQLIEELAAELKLEGYEAGKAAAAAPVSNTEASVNG